MAHTGQYMCHTTREKYIKFEDPLHLKSDPLSQGNWFQVF
jgi:hypothetical protein